MTALLTLALVTLACVGAVSFVAVRSMRYADLARSRDHALLSSMADRLQAGTLERYVAATEPSPEPNQGPEPLGDPEQQGILDMVAAGLDPDEPDDVHRWQTASERIMSAASIGGLV